MMDYISTGQPMAPIAKGFFPMGISKIGPNKFSIKARVILPNADPRMPRHDRRAQEVFTGTKAQADDRYLEMRRDLRGERRPDSCFRDFLESYKTSRGGEIPRSERSVYEALDTELGPIALDRMDQALELYFNLMRRMPSKHTGKKLSNASINRRRAMVAAALNLAIETKRLKENPLTKAVWPKLEEVPRDRRLTPLETVNLMNTVDREAPHLRYIFWYALRVPCRKSELIHMSSTHDLDLINNLIRVPDGTTKSGKGVWKPIPPEMKNYFRSIPAGCPYVFWRLGRGKTASQYLPLGDFHKSWTRCLRLAGIHNFRFHDTRHIAATNLVNAGMSERDVMKIAGWETNMLSTYWGSGDTESAARATFLPEDAVAGGNMVASLRAGEGQAALIGMERAVS